MRALVIVAIAMLTATAGRAEGLKIAIGAAISSLDPHFHNLAPNHTVFAHFFDRLVSRTPTSAPVPALAVSWTPIGDSIWEFKLRPGVTWHDGSPLTADDVAFSIARAPHVPNSPGGHGSYLSAVSRTEVVDSLTIRLHTNRPAPNQPTDLAQIGIVSRRHGEDATTADYNSGKAMIGTGPFRFTRYLPGDRVEMVRNEDWWGPKPEWDRVEIRFIPNPAARTAALLSQTVDLIDMPPVADLPRIRADARFATSSRQGMRVIYIRPNFSHLEEPPYVTDHAGMKLPKNPLMDVRVRRALSMAIDRQGLAERVHENAAVPTGQWLPDGAFGFNPEVKVPSFSPEGAKRLLAEAGYPRGFKLVLHTPNDRYPKDAATSQAVAQMWTRIGVRTEVEALPFATLAARTAKQDYSIGLGSFGSTSGEAGSALVNLVATYDPATGRGANNSARYSNPAIDALIDKALATISEEPREALLREVVKMAMDDLTFIPLYNQINTWAFNRAVFYPARSDERTFAFEVVTRQ
jgi:peptide/nickel transport system substrate-binding protein